MNQIVETEKLIKVDGINRFMTDETFHELFSNVGLIDSVSLHFNRGASTGYALIVFNRSMDAKRAPALSGAIRCNASLNIYPANGEQSPKFNDDNALSERKNLYVLNIPLDMTSDEFRDLFVPYGNVTHAVILAMLDTHSRRRGFVDMATPQEASEALHQLNGMVIRTYRLEVSYALVQRSGSSVEDRNRPNRPIKHRVPVLSSRAAKEPNNNKNLTINSSNFPLPVPSGLMESKHAADYMSRSYSQPQPDYNHCFNPYVSIFAPNSYQDSTPMIQDVSNQISLIIKNLPIALVKSDTELKMFIKSFGPVEGFRANLFAPPDSIVASAIVTFVSPSDAALLMHAINEKFIGGHKIEITHSTGNNNNSNINNINRLPPFALQQPTLQKSTIPPPPPPTATECMWSKPLPDPLRRTVSTAVNNNHYQANSGNESPRYFSAPNEKLIGFNNNHNNYNNNKNMQRSKSYYNSNNNPGLHLTDESKAAFIRDRKFGGSSDRSSSSLESLIEKIEINDDPTKKLISTPDAAETSYSSNEINTPLNTSGSSFNIQNSPLIESPIYKIKDASKVVNKISSFEESNKENLPIITRTNRRFNID